MEYKSIIEELYNGNINPMEDRPHSYGPEHNKLKEIIVTAEDKLIKFLRTIPTAGEELRLLSQFTDAQIDVGGLCEMERFVEGFRLGARIILDTFMIPGKAV